MLDSLISRFIGWRILFTPIPVPLTKICRKIFSFFFQQIVNGWRERTVSKSRWLVGWSLVYVKLFHVNLKACICRTIHRWSWVRARTRELRVEKQNNVNYCSFFYFSSVKAKMFDVMVIRMWYRGREKWFKKRGNFVWMNDFVDYTLGSAVKDPAGWRRLFTSSPYEL